MVFEKPFCYQLFAGSEGQKIKRKLLFKKTSSFIEIEPIDIHNLDNDENLIVKNKILGDNFKIYKLRLDELESI